MQKNTIDGRGLACPKPVILTKQYILEHKPEQLTVFVDNEPAVENVTRLLKSQGFTVQAEKTGKDIQEWSLKAARDSSAPLPEVAEDCDCPGEKVMVVIASNTFGSGSDELGAKLMKNFLSTLPEFGPDLWRLVLLNGGVKLATKGTPVLDELKAIEKTGASVLSCGACLEYYKLTQERVVGETTNMLDIITSMQLADKVIKI